MGKFVTITDIANKLGISHSTVSRALNGHPSISTKTTKKIRALAEELGYQNNSLANHFSKGQSKLIGIIVPDLTVYFYATVVKTLQDQLMKNGYHAVLFNTSERMDQEIEAIAHCINRRVDGVVAAITINTTTFNHFEKLIDYKIPLVFVDRVANFLPVPKVITNDHKAAYSATSYLIKSGCKKIAHITASINLNNSNNRLYGYMDALRDHQMPIDESLIHYYNLKVSSIDTFLKRTLKNHPDLDGLFVFNDYVANYVVNTLHRLGKAIPDEISVIGFSDEPVATYMTPQLSSVQQTAAQLANKASDKLLAVLDEREAISDEKIIVDPKLVLRGTTR